MEAFDGVTSFRWTYALASVVKLGLAKKSAGWGDLVTVPIVTARRKHSDLNDGFVSGWDQVEDRFTA